MTDQDPLTTLERLLKEERAAKYAAEMAVINMASSREILRLRRARDLATIESVAHLRNLAPALLEVVKAAREFHAITQGERNMDKWNQLGAALRAMEVTK